MTTPREHTSVAPRRARQLRRRVRLARAAPSIRRARARLRRAGSNLGALVRGRPLVGVALIGGLTLLAADAVGIGEAALALGAGYAGYRLLRRKARERAGAKSA